MSYEPLVRFRKNGGKPFSKLCVWLVFIVGFLTAFNTQAMVTAAKELNLQYRLGFGKPWSRNSNGRKAGRGCSLFRQKGRS
jgi:hypothetical protein